MAKTGNETTSSKKDDTAKKETAKLAARWFQQASGSEGNRRDAALAQLRQVCVKGCAARPYEMDLRGINLSNEDLAGLDLSGYDLTGADLSLANLSDASLSRAKLDNTILYKTIFHGAELLGASLAYATLDECQAERAGFAMADLTKASVINANLSHSSLSRAKLTHADFATANLEGASIREADLSHANFTRATLDHADLTESNVNKAVFRLAGLRAVRLMLAKNYPSADWIGADIRDLDMRGACMIRRHIMDENYIYEFRSRNKLNEMIYWIWWLTSDCGRSLLRWSVVVLAIAVFFALCYTQAEIDYGKYPTSFSPFYYSVVTLATLGYGDVMPASIPGQVLAISEAMAGYVGLGGMLSIISNKMARRAE